MSVLRIDRQGPRHVLTLARPEKMNALSADLVEALIAALDEAEAQGAKVSDQALVQFVDVRGGHRHALHIQGLQLSYKVAGIGGLFPPALTNVAVDQDLCSRLHTRSRCCLRSLAADGEPLLRCTHEKLPAFVVASRAECRQFLGFTVSFHAVK